MPRDAQGLYTLPSQYNPVLPETVIESAWANTTMDDIAAALTGSLPRNGSAPMTGPLNLINAPPTQPRHATNKAYVDTFMAYATGMPVSCVFPLAANITLPPSFLLCDGQNVSRTAYADLFAAIGTTYGAGDGVNTFAVPDLRDWFIRGKADSRQVGSQQSDSNKAHSHGITDPTHTHTATIAPHNHVMDPHTHGVTDPGHVAPA